MGRIFCEITHLTSLSAFSPLSSTISLYRSSNEKILFHRSISRPIIENGIGAPPRRRSHYFPLTGPTISIPPPSSGKPITKFNSFRVKQVFPLVMTKVLDWERKVSPMAMRASSRNSTLFKCSDRIINVGQLQYVFSNYQNVVCPPLPIRSDTKMTSEFEGIYPVAVIIFKDS